MTMLMVKGTHEIKACDKGIQSRANKVKKHNKW